MTPTPLEVAAALRSAAEFCRDPDSPKDTRPGGIAPKGYAAGADGLTRGVSEHDAVTWCALGWVYRLTGTLTREVLVPSHVAGPVIRTFDTGEYEDCARHLDCYAAEVEASLPLAAERVTRDEVVNA